jgi:DeoR family transcriptional regulator, fructose operon transcriptional repressor
MDSITEKRRTQILERLSRQEPVKVAELSRRFGVSEVSIRRDMRHLEAAGLLKRIHGGAIAVSTAYPGGEPARPEPGPQSPDPRIENKQRIGRAAAALIRRGDRLIFDSGTTPLQVAAHIAEDTLNTGNLTVITASLPIVRRLGVCKGLQLIVLGGIYLPESEAMAGPQTIDNLKSLHADKMFLGTDGLSFSEGLTTANVLEAEVEQAMLRATGEVIVVADSSKIGGVGLATIMPLTSINKLITDMGAPADFVARLRDQGVEVILV